jgi:hypothetical protein
MRGVVWISASYLLHPNTLVLQNANRSFPTCHYSYAPDSLIGGLPLSASTFVALVRKRQEL